jgi:hypothetical protein
MAAKGVHVHALVARLRYRSVRLHRGDERTRIRLWPAAAAARPGSGSGGKMLSHMARRRRFSAIAARPCCSGAHAHASARPAAGSARSLQHLLTQRGSGSQARNS